MSNSNERQTEADRLRAACRAVACREDSCKRPIIYLRNPKTGKQVPCDAETVGADHDHYDRELGHVSHFTTCKTPGRFSKGKQK